MPRVDVPHARRSGGRWRSLVVALCLIVTTGIPAVRAEEPTELPAGAQFNGPPQPLPDGFQMRDPGLVADRDGTLVILGTTKGTDRNLGDATVAIRAPDGEWSMATVDDLHGYRPPRGLPKSDGYYPVGFAAGPLGFVALGRTTFLSDCGRRCNVTGQDGQVHSLIWTSPDGQSWRRVDPRDVLGQRTTIALEAVMATADGGWIVAGSMAPDFRKPSRIVVLTSPDGVHWRRSATIAGPRSLEALRLHDVGGIPLMTGLELVCTRDSTHHSITSAPYGRTVFTSRTQQLRSWRSNAAGTDWQAVDLGRTGVVEAPARSSLKPRDCDVFDSAVVARTSGSGSLVGTADGSVLALSGDGTRAAVSSDLERWTVAELPGALPGASTITDRGVTATMLVAGSGDSLWLLSLELRRDPADDHVMRSGHQVITWHTADGGASWVRMPATRPVLFTSDDGLPSDRAGAALTVIHCQSPGSPSTARLARPAVPTWWPARRWASWRSRAS